MGPKAGERRGRGKLERTRLWVSGHLVWVGEECLVTGLGAANPVNRDHNLKARGRHNLKSTLAWISDHLELKCRRCKRAWMGLDGR